MSDRIFDPANPQSGCMLMSAGDLAAWGGDFIAYLKPVDLDGRTVFIIHAADGREIGMASTRDEAIVAVMQNDMEPASVH